MPAIRITIRGKRERDIIRAWLDVAPDLSRVTLDEPQRSFDQNRALWAALTEISEQLVWHGQTYSPTDWKDYMVHALKRARWMPSEDGGMVPIGMSTSGYSWRDFGDLLTVAHEFGARNGVVFKPDQDSPATETTERPTSLRGVAA